MQLCCEGCEGHGTLTQPDVKDMGHQMGYRSLGWNWPKEAKNIHIGAGIVDGAKVF